MVGETPKLTSISRSTAIARKKLQPHLALLVGRLECESEPLWSLVRIVNVLGPVLVSVVHHQHRALREEDRFAVVVIALPVEFPVLDEQKPAFGSVRQNGIALHLSGQMVGMRTGSQDLKVHGQHVCVLNRVICGADGNINPPPGQAEKEGRIRRRLLGEVESHRRLESFRN